MAKGEIPMKRFAVLTLLLALSAAWSMPTKAQDTENDHQSQKLAQKKQTALYKYQKSQERAQQKAQRKAEKKQQKEEKKNEKQQRKLLKNASRPAKQTS
jgi:hypothetical protein